VTDRAEHDQSAQRQPARDAPAQDQPVQADRPLSILLLASQLPPVTSGVARSVDRLRRGLEERGHRVDAVSALADRGLTFGEYRVHFIARRFARLARFVDGYDVVGLHGPSPFCSELFLARIALARRRPAVVYTHHFQVMVEAAGRGRAVLGQAQVAVNTAQESLARVADAVVVTSPTYADIMAHAGVPGAHVIPWGVDAVDPIDDDAVGDGDDHPDHADVRRSDVGHHRPLRVLFVGQMRSYKGIPVLLDALDGLDGVEATLVGGGLEEATYRDRAARLGLTNAVFTGRVPHDELLAAYRSHDVIVLPSVNELEAFGMVLLEGMSAGLVPVSTDLPGLGDVVGDTGRVVPRRDPVALRAALASLAADPLERRRLSAAARRRAATFTWERTIDGYEAVLSDAVGRRSIAGGAPGPGAGRRRSGGHQTLRTSQQRTSLD
jgi:rhamnosyl/mannosyltransferase